jgi:sugar O-acyltransferase (sialic acid O-acetyltransferase NeuD family)
MNKSKKLIIVGIGETAEIAYEYFTFDSSYEVVGFSANKEFIQNEEFLGLPVHDFATLEVERSPLKYEVFIAISHVNLNRNRAKMYYESKEKGFKCANYISSRAFVWRNVEIGDNVFIFENNVVQHKAKLGSNITLWSGNHIGHSTIVHDHVFVSSHCIVAGFCEVGEFSFLGVNSTCNDNITVAKDNIIGSGALIWKNTKIGQVMIGSPAVPSLLSSYQTMKIAPEMV